MGAQWSYPIGFKGFVIAGVLSAAMSTLSSSINSLASSTLKDWFPKYKSLKVARLVALFWTFILILVAYLFNDSNNSGALLSTFKPPSKTAYPDLLVDITVVNKSNPSLKGRSSLE